MRWLGMALGLLTLLVLWQGWGMAVMQGELDAVRAEVDALRAADEARGLRAGSDRRGRLRGRGRGADALRLRPRSAMQAPPVEPAPRAVDERAVREAVDQAMAQAKEEAQEASEARFVAAQRKQVGQRLDQLVVDGVIDRDDMAAVQDLMVSQALEVWALKADVGAGRMTDEEAMTHYREVRADYRDALVDRVGSDAADVLMSESKGDR